MLREARRRGPAAAVRAGEGAGRGPGREPAPSRRSPRALPRRAGPGAGVCREAAVAAGGGDRRAWAALGGQARGCFSCNLFTPSLYWGGKEGSEAGPLPAWGRVRVPSRNNGFCTLAFWARRAVLAPRQPGWGEVEAGGGGDREAQEPRHPPRAGRAGLGGRGRKTCESWRRGAGYGGMGWGRAQLLCWC